ncbi:hypothetical protein [Actinomadura sp. K4S16]|uniref:hypothetical protein n=1 Tax=Actinomadura sp. K4S16 TaxID=1316147 RepID=UPI0011ED1DAD|nr:hypothetical protein [Actinomadura sp. K4S16]
MAEEALEDEPGGSEGQARRDRSVPQQPITPPPMPMWQPMASEAVAIASFLATAGLAGVVGNRVDAAVGRLFRSVHRRWRRRASGSATPLEIEEAVDAAKAAAGARGFRIDTVTVVAAWQDAGGFWAVRLWAHDPHGYPRFLHIIIPPGDPAHATISIWQLEPGG